MPKPKTISQLKKQLWKIVSRYIRLKFSVDGYCTCVTCGVVQPWQTIHAGHFIPSAQGNATRWLEENIHPQCLRCNCHLGGNGPEFTPYMVEMYGQAFVDELRRLSKTTVKITRSDYQEMIKDFSARLAEIEEIKEVA